MSATTWSIDPLHSEVQFKVKHLVISTVTGSFTKFQGSATTQGDDFENAAIEFSLDTDSISTHQAQRDEHLRSPEFFDTATYPTISFRSTGISGTPENFTVTGNLTIMGKTLPITLSGKAADGKVSGTGTIVQTAFGIKPFSALMGALKVADEVGISFELTL